MLYDSIQLFEGSKLLNVVVDSGSSFPTSANAGELFFYTSDNKLYLYNGTTWIDIGTGSIPAQTGNSGKYLTTNGSALSWAAVEALPSQTNNSGKYLTTNGTTASWSTVDSFPSQTGNSGKYLTTNGTAVSWSTVDSFPSQTGNSGKYLTTNGTTVSWATVASADATTLVGTVAIANGGTGLTAVPGSSGQLLFNSSGAYSAAARMSYNGTSLLTVGSSDNTFTIKAAAASAIGFNACDLVIQAGSSANSVAVSGGRSGHLTVAGGDGDAGSGSGGDVIIRGGTGPVSSGTVYIRTGNSQTERLQISPVGAWGLSGANYGTNGQVLTSSGSNSAPTWTTISAGGASTSSTNTWTATQTFSGSSGNPSVAFGNAYTENQGAVTAASTTTIDCSVANNFTVTLAANITTLTFTNVPVSGRNYSVSLFLLQDSSGGKTITWPNSVRWPGGSPPAITSTANKYDVISLVTFDGGTSWLGFVAGQNF